MNQNPEVVRQFFDHDQSCLQRLRGLWRIIDDQWRAWRASKGWTEEARLILTVLRFIWKHGVLIVLILVPILLLWLMDQGRDLILNLFQSRGSAFYASDYIRMLWMLAMLTLQAYAIWVIPNFYIRAEIKKQKQMDVLVERGVSRSDLPFGGTISMSSNFLRLLSILPLGLYGITFAIRVQVAPNWSIGFWGVNAVLAALLLLGGICAGYGLRRLREVAGLIVAIILVIPIGFALVLGNFPGQPELAYAVLGNSLLICSILLFALFHRWERRFDTADPTRARQLAWLAGQIYRYVGLGVLVFGLMLMFWPNTMRMATIPVLIFFVAAYILVMNLVTYWYRLLRPTRQLIFWGAVGVIILLMVLRPSKGHYVHLVNRVVDQPRVDYADYQSAWLAGRLGQDSICSPVIYLVAGEGGGSRAAYWTSRLLGKLDSASGYRFADRLFALSTVSGSSAGTSAWYKLLRFADSQELDLGQKDRIGRRFSSRTFGHNFVTGSIIDILTRDLFKLVTLKIWRTDRNLRLQEEENYGFLFGLGKQTLDIRNTYKRGSCKADSLEVPGGGHLVIPNLHFTALPDLYQDGAGQPVTRWPLLLFNTTHMQTGRRGVLSPVRLDDRMFIDAIDVIGQLDAVDHRRARKKSIALGTANNMSEAFPVFSAFSYVDSVGNFMDGGAYENKGLTTILEVYGALRAELDAVCPEARIVVLAMENGTPSDKDITRPIHQSPAMLLQASSAPFTSQTEAARKRAVRMFEGQTRDKLIFMSLSERNGDEPIPLARDLSMRSMQIMDRAAGKAVDSALFLLRPLDPHLFHREKTVTPVPDEDE